MKFAEIGLMAVTAALMVGCTSTEALGDRAIEYNKELEESTNITLLANVVRSSDRLPMAFSRLGSMSYTGSLELGPSATFGVGANSDKANDVLGFTLGSDDSGVTPFEALTGQKYHRAVTKSIEPSLVSFYRDRGWSDAILFSLFIEKIEMGEVFLQSVRPDLFQPGLTDAEASRRLKGLTRTLEGDNAFYVFDNNPDDVHE